MAGKSIRDNAFRSRFHAAVVAIKRNGMPLQWTGQQIGDEVLRVRLLCLLCLLWSASREERQAAYNSTPAPPAPLAIPLPQVGDHLLLDVAPQFWTAPEVNACFIDITKGGQVGRGAAPAGCS